MIAVTAFLLGYFTAGLVFGGRVSNARLDRRCCVDVFWDIRHDKELERKLVARKEPLGLHGGEPVRPDTEVQQ